MNISTPIDDKTAWAASPADPARLVEGAAPILLVDPSEAQVLAANKAAERLLGLAGPGPVDLDQAMPAWEAIRDFAASTDMARGEKRPLLLWSATGPRVLDAIMEKFTRAGRVVVRIELSAAPVAAAAREAPQSSRAAEQQADLATLREIARRIRAGTGGEARAEVSAPEPGLELASAAVEVQAPPALDFRLLDAPAPTSSASAMPAAPAVTAGDGAIARLAHELRTPLSAIVSLAEIMRDERLGTMGNQRYKTYAADIHDSARHTLDMIAAMLDGARDDDAGARKGGATARLDLDGVDVAEIAARCVSAMQPIAARGGVALDARSAGDLPLVLADRRALRQIILNLLSNGLRFTPRGGTIVVAATRRDDGGVDLTVADTGSGMSEADIARALSPTSAAPRRLRIAGQHVGMGFGLPLVRELAEAHGGVLLIDSKPGAGTRMTIRLPAASVLPP